MKRLTFMLFIAMVLVACTSKPSSEDIAQAVAQTLTAQVPISTETVAPTETMPPTITSTPAPTRTPAPTSTPRPTFTPTAQPEPVEFSGTGDSVIDTERSFSIGIVKITYNGPGHFAVKSYSANGDPIDLLVNTVGNYSGTRLIDIRTEDNTARMEVTASGEWTIRIAPIDARFIHTCDGQSPCTGIGDDVIIFVNVEPDYASVINNGDSHFAVWAYGTSGSDLLINEVGAYTGTIMFDRGVMVLEIISNGEWSLDITTR